LEEDWKGRETYLNHFKARGTGYPANTMAKYKYRIASAVAQARSIAGYASEGLVTSGNA
jgi:hypothetical protein